MSEINLTEMERAFLDGFAESPHMFLEHVQGYVEGIRAEQFSGVVSSLVKKGLIKTTKYEDPGQIGHGMEVVMLTSEGQALTVWKDYKGFNGC